MGVTKVVRVRTESSQALVELYGIRADLETTVQFCDRLTDALGGPPPDGLLLDGLSAAAVIRYARCFSTGVRPKIDSVLANLPEDLAAFHQYLVALRNRFVAHSVNPYERNNLTVSVPEQPPPGWKPTAVGYSHQRRASLALPEVEALRELALAVDEEVEKLMEKALPEVLAEVQQLPAADLTAREVQSVDPMTLDQATKRR